MSETPLTREQELNKAIVDFWAGMDRRDAESIVEAKERAQAILGALQRNLADAMRSHSIMQEGYTELRKNYDTLHRQFTELKEKHDPR
jgi:predicted nuclease with TOPRIM domain